MMKNFVYILPVLLITVLAGCASAPSTPAPDGLEQSGTFTVREDHVLRLASGASGKGTLIFLGWEHRFTFTDAKLSVAGKEDVELEGTVYNLETLEDFNGTYKPVKVEFKAGEGLRGLWARNDNGVTFHLRTTHQDVSVNLEAKGATFTLE